MAHFTTFSSKPEFLVIFKIKNKDFYNTDIQCCIPFSIFLHYAVETRVQTGSTHGSSNGRHCFWCFSQFCQKFCFCFCFGFLVWRNNNPDRMSLSLVKHIYSIQAIILNRPLRWRGVSKVCVSFADKCIIIIVLLRNINCGYTLKPPHRLWVLVRTCTNNLYF